VLNIYIYIYIRYQTTDSVSLYLFYFWTWTWGLCFVWWFHRWRIDVCGIVPFKSSLSQIFDLSKGKSVRKLKEEQRVALNVCVSSAETTTHRETRQWVRADMCRQHITTFLSFGPYNPSPSYRLQMSLRSRKVFEVVMFFSFLFPRICLWKQLLCWSAYTIVTSWVVDLKSLQNISAQSDIISAGCPETPLTPELQIPTKNSLDLSPQKKCGYVFL